MKKIKVLFSVLISLLLVFTLASCGGGGDDPCTEHKDEDGNGVCDACKENMPDDGGETGASLALIEGGELKFRIVMNKLSPSTIRTEVTNIVELFSDFGMTLEVAYLDSEESDGIEVLVGEVDTRGEKFNYPYHDLGPDGKAIKIIDNKLIIAGGSEDSLLAALETFAEEILGLTEDTETLYDVTVTDKDCFEKYHDKDDYRFSSISVGGNDLSDYVMILDTGSREIKAAAALLQSHLYTSAGYWLDFVDASDASSANITKAFVIKEDKSIKDDGGFKIAVSGDKLTIAASYLNRIEEAIEQFILTKLTLSSGDVKFDKNFTYEYDITHITYEKYEAVGDGKTDDFEAMRAAHDYANRYGHVVKATQGKKYYIGDNGNKSITIKTDVVWTGATIIIDDSKIKLTDEARTTPVFIVQRDTAPVINNRASEFIKKLAATGLSLTTESDKFFNYEPGHEVMLIPYDETHKIYIRGSSGGVNSNSGQWQHEVLLVHPDGTIDESTPVTMDFSTVTCVYEYRIDDTPIKITGGTVITKANTVPTSYSYYDRNISIGRSNVTIDGITHKIEGEGDTGAPYTGFISIEAANNVRIQNSEFQAHRCYKIPSDNGKKVGMGTYEFNVKRANNVYFYKCTQSNFKDKKGNVSNNIYDENGKKLDDELWGVMGSNYCKNLTYDTCTLNRFDAHAGIYNPVIKNTNIISMALIGFGTAKIENTKIYGTTVVNLRADYGSTWEGEISITNCTVVSSASAIYMVGGTWSNRDIGFTTAVPNVSIDGLKIDGPATKVYMVHLVNATQDITADKIKDNKGNLVDNKNKTKLPEYLKVKNSDIGGVEFVVAPQDSYFNEVLEITFE